MHQSLLHKDEVKEKQEDQIELSIKGLYPLLQLRLEHLAELLETWPLPRHYTLQGVLSPHMVDESLTLLHLCTVLLVSMVLVQHQSSEDILASDRVCLSWPIRLAFLSRVFLLNLLAQ